MPFPDDRVLHETAYAKVNLTLEVLGRRSDGYHEIRSIFQSIDLADHLTFRLADGLHLDCDVGGLEGPSNLAMRAARLLQSATGHRQGVHIELRKAIPVAAGLGGGSSDAAATLRGLNRLWGLDLPVERLEALAAQVGSDAPFFIRGGTALVSGRGERVCPLPSAPPMWLVLLVPPLRLDSKTAHLYSLLDETSYTSGEATCRLSEELQAGRTPPELLFNVFEQVMRRAFPGIDEYVDCLMDAGASSVHLTGSGPALYTVAREWEQAEGIMSKLKAWGESAFVARTVAGISE